MTSVDISYKNSFRGSYGKDKAILTNRILSAPVSSSTSSHEHTHAHHTEVSSGIRYTSH